jgi:two-component system chemotaxis response regulator CheY
MAKILIVDDNAFMRNTIKGVLTQAGFDIAGEATDGVEAVSTYASAKPDLVTMDITMPNMDGVEALKELLNQDPAAKVVMVSAMGQESLVVEAVTAGAVDFVVKPFEPDRVVDAITKALA